MKSFVAGAGLILAAVVCAAHAGSVEAALRDTEGRTEAATFQKGEPVTSFSALEEVDGEAEEQELDSTSLMQTASRVRIDGRRGNSMWAAGLQLLMAVVLLLPALVVYGGFSQQTFLGVVGLGDMWATKRQQGLRAGRKLSASGAPSEAVEQAHKQVAPSVPDSVVDEIMKESDAEVATFRLQTQAELVTAEKTTTAPAAAVVPDSVVDAIMAESDLDVSTFRLQTEAELLPAKEGKSASVVTDQLVDSFLDDAEADASEIAVVRLQTGSKVR